MVAGGILNRAIHVANHNRIHWTRVRNRSVRRCQDVAQTSEGLTVQRNDPDIQRLRTRHPIVMSRHTAPAEKSRS